MSSTKRARKPGNTLRRLPLASLRVFVIAAEELNFSRAGAALGLSTAAVSMQIRALEEYLRVSLFVRSGRRVALSAQGQALLPRARRALEDMESAIDALRADAHSGHLTVSMLSSFLQQWLLRRLPDFQARHPAIDLRIETSRTLIDFLRTDVQVAIRLGPGTWPNLYKEKLFDEWWVPACSPGLFAKHGPVETAADLKRYKLIHSSSEPWESWRTGGAQEVWAKNGSTLDDSASVVHAAIAGQGLALVRWSLAVDEVVAGRLTIASSKLVEYEYKYYFVCPEANLSVKKVDEFRRWLFEQARTQRPPQEFIRASWSRC
jgi:LysR family transcriptional regulator, glycine cleavage system transcriptional activator